MKTISRYWRASAAALLGTWALSAGAQIPTFTNDLVVYLNFDGNVAAQRGTTNEGVVVNGTANYIPGMLGQAAHFNNNGSSSAVPSDWAVSLGNLAGLYSSSFSVSLWVRMFADVNAAVLGNKRWGSVNNVGWAVTTRNGRNVQWATASSHQEVDLHPPLLQGDWHLVTLTFNRTNNLVTVYRDGGNPQTRSLSVLGTDSLTPTQSYPTLVGASGSTNYAGRTDMDDLGMWRRVLTAPEVGMIYTYGIHGTNLGLNLPPPPVITLHPVSTTVVDFATATFTGDATGVGVQYEWLFDGVPLPDSANRTLTLKDVQLNQSGNYSLVAFNTGGARTSSVARLTVNRDTIPPTLTCAPPARTVECGAPWSFDSPTATDNSGDQNAQVTMLSTTTNGTCGDSFVAERRWQARDRSGNTSPPCTQTVTVSDTTRPVLTCVPAKTIECGQPWAFDPPTASDACVFNSIIYDNSLHDLTKRFNPGLTEVGNEIILDGTARHLTQFVFEYWGTNNTQAEFQGPVYAQIRFYKNDGPTFNGYPTPSTVLYDSGAFPVKATTRSTLIFENFVSDATVPLVGPVPDRFTWTVQFAGLGPNDSAGLDLFSPAIVGTNYWDYWERAGNNWLLKTNPTVEVSFAAFVAAAADPIAIDVVNTVTNKACGATMTATRTWRATDPCGNFIDCSQKVTVVDTTPPTLRCAPDSTVECGEAWAFSPPSASDQCVFQSLVYDNSVNDLSRRFNPTNQAGNAIEVGDEILLAGTARYARQFVFEYWGVNVTNANFVGNVQARVRFYRNDGTNAPFNGNPTPRSVLYDSGDFAVIPMPRATLVFDDFVRDAVVPLQNALPDSFTWTIQFTGLGPGDSAGLDLFSPTVLGINFTDYWERAGNNWILKTNPAVAVEFAALLIASEENVTVGVLSTVTNAGPVAGTLVATRTWVATDLCDNTATCSQKVTVRDTTLPNIDCPLNLTVACDAELPPPNPGSVVASDTCVGPPVVQHAGDVESGTLPRIVTRTYRARDASGNVATCDQTITFGNTASVRPTIVQHPGNRTNNVGTVATFTVVATSCEAPTFKWYFNSALLPGETSATLSIASVALSDAGDYYAVAFNTAGFATSQVARLTVNRPPIAVSDQITAATDVERTIPIGTLLANDSDPDNDPLRVISVSTPTDQGGRAILSGTQVIYSPPSRYAGSDFFFYTIADGRGAFDTTQVEMLVDSPVPPLPGYLQIFHTANGGYLLRFTVAVAGTYRVERAPSLGNPDLWIPLGTLPLLGVGETRDFVDPTPTAGMAFYRFKSL